MVLDSIMITVANFICCLYLLIFTFILGIILPFIVVLVPRSADLCVDIVFSCDLSLAFIPTC